MLMHKRTKACQISKKTKEIVHERDGGCCIFCGAPGLPEAHVVPRSHGGLGCEENIVTACRICHDRLDNSTHRQQMLQQAADYLKSIYAGWNPSDYVFDKWQKDKGSELINVEKVRNFGVSEDKKEKKVQKDKGKPPDGFWFIGGDDD